MVADDSLSTTPPDPTKMYIKRVLQCRLVLNAVEAKSLLQWLSDHVNKYEKTFGKIVKPTETFKKREKPPRTVV